MFEFEKRQDRSFCLLIIMKKRSPDRKLRMRSLQFGLLLLLSTVAAAQNSSDWGDSAFRSPQPLNLLTAWLRPTNAAITGTRSAFELPSTSGGFHNRSDASSGKSAESIENLALTTRPATSVKPRTLDKRFILVHTVNTLALIADLESTAHAVSGKTGAVELNPLFGQHPSRARLYGIGVPMNALTFFLSYRAKKAAPARKLWLLPPAVTIGVHTAAVINNEAVAQSVELQR